MFSQGQEIFAGFFVVAFIILLIFSYRKDLKLHRKYYKGSLLIAIDFIIFILLLFVLKKYLSPMGGHSISFYSKSISCVVLLLLFRILLKRYPKYTNHLLIGFGLFGASLLGFFIKVFLNM